MSDYTLVNFAEAEDMAAGHGLSPQLESRFLRTHLDSEHLGVSFFRVAPNFRTPFGHKHSVQEEAYVVVAGSGRVLLGEDVVELALWDVVRVAPDVQRAFEAGPDGMDLIAVGGPNPEGGDGVAGDLTWPDPA